MKKTEFGYDRTIEASRMNTIDNGLLSTDGKPWSKVKDDGNIYERIQLAIILTLIIDIDEQMCIVISKFERTLTTNWELKLKLKLEERHEEVVGLYS